MFVKSPDEIFKVLKPSFLSKKKLSISKGVERNFIFFYNGQSKKYDHYNLILTF